MEGKRSAVETSIRGARVTIKVSGDFLEEAEVAGNVQLWPEVTAEQAGTVSPREDRFWTFQFKSPEEARSFAEQHLVLVAEAKKKLQWED